MRFVDLVTAFPAIVLMIVALPPADPPDDHGRVPPLRDIDQRVGGALARPARARAKMSATTVEPDPRLPVGEASSRLAMPGWRSMRRLVREPLAIVALLILLALLITGALAHQIAPEGWNSIDVSGQWLNHAPTFTANHLLGTDNIGRDVGWRPPEHSS